MYLLDIYSYELLKVVSANSKRCNCKKKEKLHGRSITLSTDNIYMWYSLNSKAIVLSELSFFCRKKCKKVLTKTKYSSILYLV